MLLSGAKAQNVDFVAGYQTIVNLLVMKQFTIAALEIGQYQGHHFADRILKAILQHQNPDCWLAFLRNRYLQHEMDCNTLRSMINVAQKAVRYGGNAILKNPGFREVTVTIARNPKWCQMLSYRYFIDSVAYDEPLKHFMVNSADFIRHLEAYHLNMLIEQCPNEIANILVSITELTQGDVFDVYWANESLKWLYKHNQKVIECFARDTSMSPLLDYIETLVDCIIVIEATPMDVDEEPLSERMAVDEKEYWGYPKELEPPLEGEDELSLWLTRLEQTLYQPPAQNLQWDGLQEPIPLRIQRSQMQEAQPTEISPPGTALRKSF